MTHSVVCVEANVWAFIAVDVALILVPGPDFALVSRNTLRGGRRAGIFTAFGANLGLVIWGLATVLGLAALLAASATAYSVVKYAGAAYLITLGVLTLWRSVARKASDPRRWRASSSPVSTKSALSQGLVGSLLNPKSAVLYTALLPQFIPESAPLLPNLLLLAVINTVLALIWFCFCAIALDWLQRRLGAVLRWVERASGLLLVALGLRVASTR